MREDNLLALRRQPFRPANDDSRHGFDDRAQPDARPPTRPASISSGSPTSPTSGSPRTSSISPSSSTPSRARSSVGRSPIIWRPAWRSRRSTWRSLARDPRAMSLIHHSDRGVQYASIAYLARLKERGIAVSMSRPGNPYDNAKAESFMKTLKQEEVNGKALPQPRRRPPPDRRLHRRRLQRQAPALGARLQAPGRVRSRTLPGQPQPNKPGRSPVTELSVSQHRGAVQ